jgi:hypothetical protein
MAARSLIPIAILFAIGPIFLAATAVSFISTARFLAGTTTAQASFAGSKVRRGGSHGGAFYYRQFSFRTRDGRQVAFVAGIGFTDQPYVDRQRVTIVYDPRQPRARRTRLVLVALGRDLVPRPLRPAVHGHTRGGFRADAGQAGFAAAAGFRLRPAGRAPPRDRAATQNCLAAAGGAD